jgi:hypothetical protein
MEEGVMPDALRHPAHAGVPGRARDDTPARYWLSEVLFASPEASRRVDGGPAGHSSPPPLSPLARGVAVSLRDPEPSGRAVEALALSLRPEALSDRPA